MLVSVDEVMIMVKFLATSMLKRGHGAKRRY
jgi:hypothetical protein